MLVQSLTFAASAASLLGIRAREPSPRPTGPGSTLRAEIAEGMRFVMRNRVLRSLAVASALSNLSFAVASAVTMIFLARTLGLPAWGVGLVVAAGSGAAMVGAAVTPALSDRVGSARVVWAALAVTGPLTVLVAGARPGWSVTLVILGMAAGELGQIVYAITNVSMRQRLCPERILGRVNATMRVVIMALFPLGALAGGLLGDALGPRPTLLAAGLVALAAPAVLFPALRGYRDVEDLPGWGV
ncbi:MFS transporter [Isoptericola sp. NPDC056618]|uniref:MFS transporter n=1 Tax=Isoptericola sp. NPDC056618 TaxID=3345878 RepID=UPI0036B53D9C